MTFSVLEDFLSSLDVYENAIHVSLPKRKLVLDIIVSEIK